MAAGRKNCQKDKPVPNYIDTTEKKNTKIMQSNRTQTPFPECRAPVICTGLPPTSHRNYRRRYNWGSVAGNHIEFISSHHEQTGCKG
jgi:hypothetical protein